MRGPKTPPLEIIPVPADAPLTFDLMAQAYLEDYVLQRYRTLSTARPRVEHLREFFGGWPAETITADAVRRYQLHRREQGAEAATTNRETSALSRMFQIAIRRGLLERMPLFSNRLEEDPLRDGFSEREETGQGVHEEIDSLYTAKSACYGGRTLQMTTMPLEVALELTPRARFDVINVRERAAAAFPGALDPFPRCLYYSFHTTAGYLEQGLASRLTKQCAGVAPYVDVFRQLFPEGAAYAHDRLERRPELTRTQRAVEPRNADSHLAFIAGGLRTCVSYRNRPADPGVFVDLDGVHQSQTRRRLTTIIGYTREEDVARLSIPVLVSAHAVDSINLKDPRHGVYEQCGALIARHGVTRGRVRLELAPGERHAGLTVNEYETLLMRHDLADVLSDPLRYAAEKGRHMWANPRAIPARTLDYAKYDMVRTFNEVFDALGLGESIVQRVLSRAIALPAARFLRMKRSVSLLVSDRGSAGRGAIIDGAYQSPILVQWHSATGRSREIMATLSRFS